MNVEIVDVEPDQEDLLWLLQNDRKLVFLILLSLLCLSAAIGVLCRGRTLDRRREHAD